MRDAAGQVCESFRTCRACCTLICAQRVRAEALTAAEAAAKAEALRLGERVAAAEVALAGAKADGARAEGEARRFQAALAAVNTALFSAQTSHS